MSNRILLTILVLSLLIQISFSFYYSSEIINQNNLLDTTKTQLDILDKQKQELENQLARLTSIKYLQTQVSQKNFIPIKNQINLNEKQIVN